MEAAAERIWLLITLPLALGAAYFLGRAIIGLVRALRRAVLVAVPLQSFQVVELPADGNVILWLEGPPLARLPTRLAFSLHERSSGAAVEGRRIWFPMTATGAVRARREFLSFRLPRPGAYELRVEGLEKLDLDPRLRLSFSRPVKKMTVAYVLAILFTSTVLTIALVTSMMIAVGGSER